MEALELKKLIAKELAKDDNIYMVYNLKGSYLKVIPKDVQYNYRYEPLINFKNKEDRFYVLGHEVDPVLSYWDAFTKKIKMIRLNILELDNNEEAE